MPVIWSVILVILVRLEVGGGREGEGRGVWGEMVVCEGKG